METIGKFTFETYESEVNSKTFFYFKLKKETPKARMPYKIIDHYRFKTEEKRDEYYSNRKVQFEKSMNQAADAKAKKAAFRKNFVNPFIVGDILVDSWGYDQTNIDFYEVTKVGKKSIKIRRTFQVTVGDDAPCGPDSSYVKPQRGHYYPDDHRYGGEITKILQLSSTNDGVISIHVTSSFGYLCLWNGEKVLETHYR